MHLLSKSRPHPEPRTDPRAGQVGVTLALVGDERTQLTRIAPSHAIEAVADVYGLVGQLVTLRSRVDAVVLSLTTVNAEELPVIQTIKAYFPGVVVWLTDAGGRSAELAQAVLLGADGLVNDAGVFRFTEPHQRPDQPESTTGRVEEPTDPASPVLSAEELSALLDGVEGDPHHPPE